MAAQKKNTPVVASPQKPRSDKTVSRQQDKRFFAEVASILQTGRKAAYASVNAIMAATYWQIGRRIVEQEQKGASRADYGEYLIVNLSRYLGDAFGKGFSVASLKNFRRFYLAFPCKPEKATQCVAFSRQSKNGVMDAIDLKAFKKATRCVANLSWTHIRLIMRLDDAQERNYYAAETLDQSWSSRVLERHIQSGYYRRIRSTQCKKAGIRRSAPKGTLIPDDLIKEPFILEFLGASPSNIREKEGWLETAIIQHVQEFLLEAGKGFSFIGRQVRISTETSDFYIDLVFYNYLLKCFVVIDLKTTKLTHQDIGQMDMYVRLFDQFKRGKDDNPTIGLILCADKEETVVKYSILQENQRLFASKYKLMLPTEEELAVELHRNALYLRETEVEYCTEKYPVRSIEY